MTKNEFRREKLYQATMSMVRRMLREGIISEDEYARVYRIFLEKYKPLLGTLFSNVALTSRRKRVIDKHGR